MTEFSFANFSSEFDDHISKSIPGFDMLNYMVVQLSDYFVRDDTNVVDIGCSTGNLIAQLYERHHDSFKHLAYVGYDVEQKMIDKAVNRKLPKTEFLKKDITKLDKIEYFTNGTKPRSNSFITSIFTLQFIERNKRKEVLQKCYDSLVTGGALVISEKVLSQSGILQNCMSFPHYDYKSQFFSEKEILDKERDLRKIMRCETIEFLYDILESVGFEHHNMQSFWRSYNFVGVIAIK